VGVRGVKGADIAGPAGADGGPRGAARYPTCPGWAARVLDIRRVRVETAGGALRLSVQMADLSTAWNPPNGFDHVAFNLFIELPGQAEPGASAMPLQRDGLPEGMRWHRRLRAHGWSNALYSARGAGAEADGASVTPAATIAADAPSHTVSFTFPASALGNLGNLAGAKLYLNTWDYDGGFRPLEAEPAAMRFGRAQGGGDPPWMDAPGVSLLPPR